MNCSTALSLSHANHNKRCSLQHKHTYKSLQFHPISRHFPHFPAPPAAPPAPASLASPVLTNNFPILLPSRLARCRNTSSSAAVRTHHWHVQMQLQAMFSCMPVEQTLSPTIHHKPRLRRSTLPRSPVQRGRCMQIYRVHMVPPHKRPLAFQHIAQVLAPLQSYHTRFSHPGVYLVPDSHFDVSCIRTHTSFAPYLYILHTQKHAVLPYFPPISTHVNKIPPISPDFPPNFTISPTFTTISHISPLSPTHT